MTNPPVPPAPVTMGLPGPAVRAASRSVRILCIHGVNHLESAPGGPPAAGEVAWGDAISRATEHWGITAQVRFFAYDKFFAALDLGAAELAASVVKLGASWIWHGAGDLFGTRDIGPQGGFGDTLEWTAGMVCKWAEDEELRKKLRQRLLLEIKDYCPQLILAHSLGSLIAYDTLARPANHSAPGVSGVALATFGSQIGHPVVRAVFGGKIVPVSALRHWFHLYNKDDHVFTAPLDVRFKHGVPPDFSQHDTPFDIPGDGMNHDAAWYLKHPASIASVWRDAATMAGAVPRFLPGFPRLLSLQSKAEKLATTKRPASSPARHRGKPAKRALLVGVSDYPDPANRLDGCTNDVFLMSRMLQKAGFHAKDIRIVLDRRATTAAILERLQWLLEHTGDGQDRVFYFAGHGAQIPGYGIGETIDRLDECLVPYDFDWSREHSIVDDRFYQLYSQLPEETRFITILDCCHAGGMTRDGGMRVRGLALPDDIRHRILEWNGNAFAERKIGGQPINLIQSKRMPLDYLRGPVRRLGCAAGLRLAETRKYNAARKAFGHHGPFMPFILQACGEGESAHEFRHGAQSNGAFTWFLGQVMDEAGPRDGLKWPDLMARVGKKISAQGYKQQPRLVCPAALRDGKIPWPNPLSKHQPT